MNQPPNSARPHGTPPDWRRPAGVAPGTWVYTNERTIADHYDAFVADTPLCETDRSILRERFPTLDSSQSAKIVDLGCGSGRTAIDLAVRGYSVVGIDLSQAMLETLDRKQSDDRYFQDPRVAQRRVQPVRANLVELDCFADDSFDHAVCMFSTLGMIQGREHRRTLLSHVLRMLSPGGRFVFHVHHVWAGLGEPGGARKLASSWWRSLRSSKHDFGDATYSYRGIEHMFMHRFSRGELKADLNATGWKIDRVDHLSADGAAIISRPMTKRHLVSGFIVTASKPG